MAKEKTKKEHKHGALIAILIILAVFAIGITITKCAAKVPDEDINTEAAYGYNILISTSYEDREYSRLRSEKEVAKLSVMLKDKYKGLRYEKTLSDIERDNTFVLIPVYRDDLGNTDEYTYDFHYGVFDDEDELFNEYGIYILSDKTIAKWDSEEKAFRICEKKGEPLDLEYIKALMKLGATDEDIEELEGAPAY